MPDPVPDVNPDRYADAGASRHRAEGAYAQVLRGLHSWMLDWSFEPAHQAGGRAVLEAALAETAPPAGDGGPVQVWVREPTPAHDEIADALGLRARRDLYELRVALPLTGESPPLDWQPFRPGVDEEAWLEVNNRAFAWHPEQHGWTREQIDRAEQEPWFDPAGFVMHWIDGRLAGFCWTKVHSAEGGAPALGEIYVIGADPDFTGRGLGRALTTAGLDWLHGHRGIDVGMLYVDADNDAAVRMYDRLGFERHHTDRAYSREPLTTS